MLTCLSDGCIRDTFNIMPKDALTCRLEWRKPTTFQLTDGQLYLLSHCRRWRLCQNCTHQAVVMELPIKSKIWLYLHGFSPSTLANSPQSTDLVIALTGDSKLSVGVNVTEWLLSLGAIPEMDWQPVQDVPHFLPPDSWESLVPIARI